jgi:hypothetical protein
VSKHAALEQLALLSPGVSAESASVDPAPHHFADAVLAQFTDFALYGQTALVLVLAVSLAAVLAYHPSTLRKATTRDDIEQPKTMILYGLVGALVGHVVHVNQAMALVIFGIGGLMRFRTDVGEAKDTGRLILSAIVGICVGLQSYLVALLATLFGWAIVWYLERRSVGTVQLLGVEITKMPATSTAYRKLLLTLGCRVVGETRSSNKGEVTLVFVTAPNINLETLNQAGELLPLEVRATPAWELR